MLGTISLPPRAIRRGTPQPGAQEINLGRAKIALDLFYQNTPQSFHIIASNTGVLKTTKSGYVGWLLLLLFFLFFLVTFKTNSRVG